MNQFKGTFSKGSILGPSVKIASEATGRLARLGISSKNKKYLYPDTPWHSMDSYHNNIVKVIGIHLKAPIVNHGMNTIVAQCKKYRLISTNSDEFIEFMKKVDAESDPTKLEAEIIKFFRITGPEDIKAIKDLLKNLKERLAKQKELKTWSADKKALAVRNGKLYGRKKPISFVGALFRKGLGREIFNREK